MLARFKAAIFLLAPLSAGSLHAEKIVLGKLGQTLKPTFIYSRQTTKSRVYYKLKSYEYVVVRQAPNSNWAGILLSNGAEGYVPVQTVATLPYQVTSEKPVAPAPGVSTRMNYGAGSRAGYQVASRALEYVGQVQYKWGGESLTNGIDCSGFVKKMYGQVAGVDLPRTAAEQALVGMAITRKEDLQAGDRLYFWDSKRGKIGHTGIYLGNGYFVHSSHGHNGVSTDDLRENRWSRILVAARR
ncbi:MAG: C40 family peptidase [Armatimonadetes bacterium]|nr:C40 family peptidase [Armatimonadota bacterium]